MKPTPITFEIVDGTVTLSGIAYQAGDQVTTIFRLDQRPGLKVKIVSDDETCDEPTEEVEVEEEDDSIDVPPADELVAVHKGKGRWCVVDASTDEKVHDGWLSREDAEELARG